jgi:hypothetical protein
MGVVISCPECHSAREYPQAEFNACAVCGAEFPPSVREEAGRAVRRRRPLLLTLFAAFFGFFAAVGAVVLLVALLGSGPYTVNGVPTSKPVFMKAVGPFLPIVVAAAILAYGLWKERLWGRPMFLAFYAVVGIASAVMPLVVTASTSAGLGGSVDANAGAAATSAELISAFAFTAVVIGFFGWYLYGKTNVVQYYRALAEMRA